METAKFVNVHDSFSLLDLVAWFDFKTQSSISFSIGNIGAHPNEHYVKGWLDIHYLPQEHIKYRIRGCVPITHLERPKLYELVQHLFTGLGVAPDETYEAWFCSEAKVCCVRRYRDRYGNSNQIID